MSTNTRPFLHRWRHPVIAVIAGILTHIATSLLLVYLLITGRDALGTVIDPHRLDGLRHLDDASTGGWFLVQAVGVLCGMAAGFVAVALSPPKSRIALCFLLMLAVASVLFAQFPRPQSVLVIAIWSLATPVGLLLGGHLGRRIT